ncbi:hypothetical protein F0U60_52465 [Archangium minus]|uniref:HEAT repeat domain-containing protein n=2 Tax=Archangium minus TaxID=83450 RepID=A0ABY9X8Q2_9BACT|nr:hypothetical protein F0U60_52465 [Archangium minus]
MTPDAPPCSTSPRTDAPPRRRGPMLVAGVGLMALLVGVALLRRGGGDEADTAEARRAAAPKDPKQGASRLKGPPGQTGPEAAGGEARGAQFDATTCWRDLERFNEEVTLDNFREWAAPLLSARDPLVRNYLKERLTELIGNDAGRALQVVDWALGAEGKSFGVFLTAVRDSEAVHLPQVSAKLLDMGMDARIAPERRAGILSALDTQKKLAPAALDRLATFASEPTSGEAGWAAARTIGRVMKHDARRNGDPAPYLDKLLTIGVESPDEQIRYLGQMMPMHAAPILDAQSTERYARILTSEGNEAGRDVAAHLLSLSPEKEKVLALFAKTFETDPSVCVRWALFRFSARVAGRDALPVMANMALADPRFQPLYQAFEQLYASGTQDWVRLWNSLPEQDPFHCLDRHD